ncbi:VanZ family protein [Erysipelothrix rhusiopathiae]|uniref:VanZ family protein n=1 Tax=Erysipelothrix rhusiopathiae TaxID=1648 RepID=UPI003AB2335F
MQTYFYPIRTALISFPFIAFAMLIPYLIYDYHKHGSVSKWRAVVIYSFIFYLLCAFYLVILPLPDRQTVHTHWKEMIQPIPFSFISDFIRESSMRLSNPSSILMGLKEGVFTQPVFNILMTVPFGIYLRYYFNCDLKKTVILSFILSLFFELTQLTGLYGLYPGPYRLFDVDDLILNTLGGLFGYGIAPLMTYFFPSREALDLESAEKSVRVTYIRRLVAYLIDTAIMSVAISVFMLGMGAIKPVVAQNNVFMSMINFIGFIFFFAIWPIVHQGSTIGMSVVQVRIVAEQSTSRIKSIILRTVLVYIFIIRFGDITGALFEMVSSTNLYVGTITLVLYLLVILGYWIFIVSHIISTLFRKDYRLFYERISKTSIVSTYHEKESMHS